MEEAAEVDLELTLGFTPKITNRKRTKPASDSLCPSHDQVTGCCLVKSVPEKKGRGILKALKQHGNNVGAKKRRRVQAGKQICKRRKVRFENEEVISAPSTESSGQNENGVYGPIALRFRMQMPESIQDFYPCKTLQHVESSLSDLPWVTTKGQGKIVSGFLLRYHKESVNIVCSCHGIIFSPSEFVQHAGGTAGPNPLKNILVNFFPSAH